MKKVIGSITWMVVLALGMTLFLGFPIGTIIGIILGAMISKNLPKKHRLGDLMYYEQNKVPTEKN